MKNKFLCIHFAYQPSKNMKYLGPKGSINTKIKNSSLRPIIMHSIENVSKYITNSDITHRVVVGFESDKVLKSIDDTNVRYSIVVDYKNTNHGKIIKDIMLKYDTKNFDGCIITSDIGFILQSDISIDINQNHIFYTDSENLDTENTCNLDDTNVEYLTYKTNNNYWTGMCFLSNETVRLIKHINSVYFTDPLFLMEVINKSISSGAKFNAYKIPNKNFHYINNNTLKKLKV